MAKICLEGLMHECFQNHLGCTEVAILIYSFYLLVKSCRVRYVILA